MNIIATGITNIVLDLPKPVDPPVAADIEKESIFVSPDIERIAVSADGKTATVSLRDGGAAEEAVDKATRYLAMMAKQRTGWEIKTFGGVERRDTGAYHTDVNGELLRRGWMHDYGKGHIAYNGPVLRLARLVNEMAGKMYEKHFDAVDGHFPGFVEADVLQNVAISTAIQTRRPSSAI